MLHFSTRAALTALAAAWLAPSPLSAQTAPWTKLDGGTWEWSTPANWNGVVPNGPLAIAQLNQNYAGATTVNLAIAIELQQLLLGDINADNGMHDLVIANTGAGRITFNQGTNVIQKLGAGIARVHVPLDLNGGTTLTLSAGNLYLHGLVSVLNGKNNNFILKNGGGAVHLVGGLNLTGVGIGGYNEDMFGYIHQVGTTNIGGTSTLNYGMQVIAGTVNFGLGTGTASATFGGANGWLWQDAGTINFGVNTAVDQPTPTSNVTLSMDKIIKNGGTLNLRNGNGLGTTTLTGSLLSLEGGTTTFYTAGGAAGGTLNIAAGATLRLTSYLNLAPEGIQPAATTLNFTSTNGAVHTFASLEHLDFDGLTDSNNTVLRAQAGNGSLRIGGDGINDIFKGQLNMASSGTLSRFVKIGAETLTLAGSRDNTTSRIRVDAGKLILAKDSIYSVHAAGGSLIIENGAITELGGSFNAFGGTAPANYNDQIFRGADVYLNGSGTLNLNGFSESFDTLLGNGIVTNNAAGTTSIVTVGQANFAVDTNHGQAATASGARIFDGTLVDGAGVLGFIKSANQTMTMTNGGNTFSGPTTVARATLQLSNAGRLQNTSSVTISRNAILLLNNHDTAVGSGADTNGRINNSAAINFDGGILTLRRSQTAVAITEILGVLNLNSSSNTIRIDHSNGTAASAWAGGNLRLTFDSLNRSPGAHVSFTEFSSNASASGFGTNPATSQAQVTFVNKPTAHMLGGPADLSGTGVNTPLLIGAFGGINASATNQFVTVVTAITGNHHVSPLVDGDYNTNATIFTGSDIWGNLPQTLGAPGTYDDVAGIGAGVTAGSTINVTQNTAVNAFRFNQSVNMAIADDKRFILGGMEANAGLGTVAFDGTGMLLFTVANTNINGGTLYYNQREAIMRVNAAANIRSVIAGSGGLSKSGTALLNLYGSNTYTGPTWLNEGALGVFNSQALGQTGIGNDVIVHMAAELAVGGGINVGDGTAEGSKDIYLLGDTARIRTDDRHNSWGGNVYLNPTNAAGQATLYNYLRVQNDGVLTIFGDVTAISANEANAHYGVDASFGGAGLGSGLVIEGNAAAAFTGSGAVINLLGKVADFNGQAATGSGSSAAHHEKLVMLVRGYNGHAIPVNSDFVVNIRDATRVNGRFDLRSGFVFIDSSYGTQGRGYTDGALLLKHNGGNVDRSGTLTGLFLTKGGTNFFGTNIQVGDTAASNSSNSFAMIGGTNRSGTVTIGNDFGTLSLIASGGNSNRSNASATAVGNNVSTITLRDDAIVNLRVGYGITGPNIAPGTFITSILGNTITLSKNTIATAPINQSYSFGFKAKTEVGAIKGNILAESTNAATNPTASLTVTVANAAGFAAGQGITGPGIPAGAVITDVIGNTIHLSVATTAAGAVDSVYRSYPAGQTTITLPIASGLRVGMGLTGTGIRVGTTITGITFDNVANDYKITLSTPINSAYDGSALVATPLATVNYRTVGTTNAGATTVQFQDVTGLTVGTIINRGAAATDGFAAGTYITGVNYANNTVTISQPTTASFGAVDNVQVQKSMHFSEGRIYAAEGGTVNLNMRVYDNNAGFSLINSTSALSKVGRGEVNLRGSRAGGSSLDGGINLLGGNLIFDYRDTLPAVDPGDPGGENPNPEDPTPPTPPATWNSMSSRVTFPASAKAAPTPPTSSPWPAARSS